MARRLILLCSQCWLQCYQNWTFLKRRETHPTATPLRKIHCSCSFSSVELEYIGSDLYTMPGPFRMKQITLLMDMNTPTPHMIVVRGRKKINQNGTDMRNASCITTRITWRKMHQRFWAEGYNSQNWRDPQGCIGRTMNWRYGLNTVANHIS